MKTREKSGSAAAKRRPLKFELELEFLKPFVKYYDSENITIDAAENYLNQEIYSDDVTQDFEEITSAALSNGDPFREPATNSFSKTSSSREVTPNVADILQSYLEAKTAKEKDPVDAFFLAMAASVKKLPLRVQLQVKQKVFHAVNDAELKVLNQGS